jgi:uncharacterized protein (DUF1330 family)
LRGIADVAPFDPPGALLLATMAGNAESAAATTWLAAAKEVGGRLLAAVDPASVMPLEGDALYNRLALLSFVSPTKRNEFIASTATQTFIKSSTPLSLIAMIAVDAPAAPPITAPSPAPAK